MAVAGSLTYDTSIDTKGFSRGIKDINNTAKSGASTFKSIIAALGIAQLVESGLNLIKSSVSDAVSRVDTLRNYPKVMSNLGIATEDSQKSIDKLSDKLTGLPTTLDDAALAVQRLTSKNGDVKKSTDYFLALNDAIIAGGASGEIQSSAIEQLSQAYARGKPDMVEWRTLMVAMPAQLKQVAEAMGYVSADALGEDLRNGNVSMEEFMETLVELDQNGVGHFQSFSQQAQNAVGGINTALTNMKTAVARGLAKVIEAIDTGLQNANLGSISEIISNVGRSFESALSTIATYIPSVINFIIQLANTINKLSPAIMGAVSAIIAYKAAVKLMAIASTIANIVKFIGVVISLAKQVKSLKDAMLLLNLVMNANPIGIIIAAIAALVAIFITLWNKSEAFRNFWIGLWDGIKNAVSKAWNGIKTFFTETIPNAFKKLKDFVKNNIKELILLIINPFAGIFALLYKNNEKFREWVNSIIEFFKQIPTKIKEFFTQALEFIGSIPERLGYLIGYIAGVIFNFITVTIPNFVNSVIQWFKSLPQKIGEFFEMIKQKFVDLALKLWEFYTVTIPNFIARVIQWFQGLPGRIWQFLKDIIAKLASWVSSMKTKGVEGAKKFFNSVVDGIKSLPGRMLQIGKNIVNGIWKGIKNAGKWLLDKIKGFADGIVSGFMDALGIDSPSKVLARKVGQWIPKGISVGIDANTDSVMKSLDNLDSQMISRMRNTVALETSRLNNNITNQGGSIFSNSIVVNAQVTGDAIMDGTKVGRIVTPVVSKTIKVGGIR